MVEIFHYFVLNQHQNIHKIQLSVTLHFFNCRPVILLRELVWFTAFQLKVCYNLLNFDWLRGANYFCAAKFIVEELALWMSLRGLMFLLFTMIATLVFVYFDVMKYWTANITFNFNCWQLEVVSETNIYLDGIYHSNTSLFERFF